MSSGQYTLPHYRPPPISWVQQLKVKSQIRSESRQSPGAIQEIRSRGGHLFGQPPIHQLPQSIHNTASVESPAVVLYAPIIPQRYDHFLAANECVFTIDIT